MRSLMFGAGLLPPIPTPPAPELDPKAVVTQEAGITAPNRKTPRVEMVVEEGATVAQGAPLARLRHAPEIQFVAPMPCRLGRANLLPGRRLSELVVYQEPGGNVVEHKTTTAKSRSGLRVLLQRAGFWQRIERRPFGGMPAADEHPAAIFVMAADTRPLAPDPQRALTGREEDFVRGLKELEKLTNGPIFLCQTRTRKLKLDWSKSDRLRHIECGPRHPQGSPGLQIHAHYPAEINRPVWDIHAEDVASLGTLMETGQLPMNRHVTVAGPMLNETRHLKTQIGADLRELTQGVAKRAPHVLLSGSPIDGHIAHWLAPRDRQISVLPAKTAAPTKHWLIAALTRSGQTNPVIPTAALTQSFGNALPAAMYIRALSSGDDETLLKLGGLSLLPEDLALADYVLGGEAHIAGMHGTMLDRIQEEYAP